MLDYVQTNINYISIPITFDNPSKACFTNKKYLIKLPTLIEKPVLSGFLKILLHKIKYLSLFVQI